MRCYFIYDKVFFENGMLPVVSFFTICMVMYTIYILCDMYKDDIKWFLKYSNPISTLIRYIKRKRRDEERKKNSYEWNIYDYIKEKKNGR